LGDIPIQNHQGEAVVLVSREKRDCSRVILKLDNFRGSLRVVSEWGDPTPLLRKGQRSANAECALGLNDREADDVSA
jgi:hypothetical protein